MYRFRLTFFTSTSGFFPAQQQSVPLELEEGHEFELRARDSDTLASAKSFHIEGGGFPNEDAARLCGERLRVRLRILNAMLGLGMNIPLVDSTSCRFSSAVKNAVHEKTGGVVLDTILGLGVFPDDDKHLELVSSCRIDVCPSRPDYILDAIRSLWRLDMTLDQRSEDALNLINIATIEPSLRAKFLTAFLALERLIDRTSRSDAAKELLNTFQEVTRNSQLTDREKASLSGSLAMLREESFSTALIRFAERIKNPTEISGVPIKNSSQNASP